MLKASVAALCALVGGCASISDGGLAARHAEDRPPIYLQAGDRIAVRKKDVSQHVCADESRLMCGYGNGRFGQVFCECQQAAASPALMR